MEEDGTDRFERADTDSKHTHTHTRTRAQETRKEAARQRRFQLSPTNRKHLTPLFSTLNADQMMISCTCTLPNDTHTHTHTRTQKGKKMKIHARAPSATRIPSSLCVLSDTLWGWMLTQQKFPVGEIPVLEVNGGLEESESCSASEPLSSVSLDPLQPDSYSTHILMRRDCVCVTTPHTRPPPPHPQPMW